MEWKWIGVGRSSTYTLSAYTEHEINDQFKNIQTLDDIFINMDNLNALIKSATGSYFALNYTTGEFYRDQQSCVIWKHDKNTKIVSAYITGNIASIHVAKSIPEFLSHLRTEYEKMV